jgi:hypothetical protein
MKKITFWKAFAVLFAIVVGVYLACPAAFAAAEEMYPNKVKTHIGELTFDHGIPTEATSKKLYYELEYHRAVQAYLWSLPIMGQTQWRQSYLDTYGIKPNQMVFATQFNERSQILTANESTPYLFGWTNGKLSTVKTRSAVSSMSGLKECCAKMAGDTSSAVA